MRPFNFAPGPSVLPEEVLRQAREELLDWRGTGCSVMEVSHRSPEFMQVYEECVALTRELLGVPDNYEVLLMHGGAVAENAIVPLNLSQGDKADYVLTGNWSEKSATEARKYCDVHLAASSQQAGYRTIPDYAAWRVRPDARYLHICTNETIHGVEFQDTPPDFGVPLTADMCSNIFSRPVPVARYGLIYAGAQKNAGQAGVTLVIVRRDLIGHAMSVCPSAFDYAVVAANQSMFNTPPTFAVYMHGLTLQWLKRQGGVVAIEQQNRRKAQLLYEVIDASSLYQNQVEPRVRSRMNVVFHLGDAALESLFVQEAKQQGLLHLKGHKLVGGIRASLYNAMPLEGAQALAQFMREFERTH